MARSAASEWYLALQKERDALFDEQVDLVTSGYPNLRPILHEALIEKNKRLLLLLDTQLDVAERVSQIVEVLSEGKLVITSPELSVEFEW